MDQLIQVDKKEWEEFLERLSELEKKYQLVLRELDTAHSRLQALDVSQRQVEEKPLSQATSAMEEKTAYATKEQGKTGFLAKLRSELRPLRRYPTLPSPPSPLNPNAPPNYASCSRCGSKILYATRFCDRCGANFGRWVCSCGHGLPESARFCDHCGRRVETTTSQVGI